MYFHEQAVKCSYVLKSVELYVMRDKARCLFSLVFELSLFQPFLITLMHHFWECVNIKFLQVFCILK
jgi:hypothetical protein